MIICRRVGPDLIGCHDRGLVSVAVADVYDVSVSSFETTN